MLRIIKKILKISGTLAEGISGRWNFFVRKIGYQENSDLKFIIRRLWFRRAPGPLTGGKCMSVATCGRIFPDARVASDMACHCAMERCRCTAASIHWMTYPRHVYAHEGGRTCISMNHTSATSEFYRSGIDTPPRHHVAVRAHCAHRTSKKWQWVELVY